MKKQIPDYLTVSDEYLVPIADKVNQIIDFLQSQEEEEGTCTTSFHNQDIVNDGFCHLCGGKKPRNMSSPQEQTEKCTECQNLTPGQIISTDKKGNCVKCGREVTPPYDFKKEEQTVEELVLTFANNHWIILEDRADTEHGKKELRQRNKKILSQLKDMMRKEYVQGYLDKVDGLLPKVAITKEEFRD